MSDSAKIAASEKSNEKEIKEAAEEAVKNDTENNNAEENEKEGDAKSTRKKTFFTENRLEILVAVFLGITALLTAWATWIGSLHGGNQATNYTRSNNLASEGNSLYNAGMQKYLSDVMAWNTMMEYSFDLTVAESEKDTVRIEMLNEKLENYVQQNGTDILQEGIQWMVANEDVTPFHMPNITDRYFTEANDKLAESRQVLEEGQKDNAKSDAYNLVNVIYSVVLFMLGIVGIFKKLPNRAVVLIIAVAALILATVYMCTIPMPTGFDFGSFFAPK